MPEKKKSSNFDWRILLGIIALVAVGVVAVAINTRVEDNSANKIAQALDIDNGDQKINWGRYQTVDVDLTETLNISESGTYHLTGTLENGQIVIGAGVSEVRLILDNASIKNSDGPAIYCQNAEDLVIETIGVNTLADGEHYSAVYDEDVTGVIYSKADLAFGGEGQLNITANFSDAIVGKDDIKFNGGNYEIASIDDAIRGKDSVYIVNGNFVIDTTNDAIKTTNEEDRGKGFILIENGNFNITAQAKGIKATNSILIYGGEFEINSRDDAIHSNNYIGMTNGHIVASTGDDGMHADRELIIDGGSINIEKSKEGLEAQVVTINDGEISIKATDDGINAGGGSDDVITSSRNPDNFKSDENCVLSINGGNIYINAAGDGVDSNGKLLFSGGKTIIDGPTNNGNGALDSGLGIEIQGGSVIAVGSSGMAGNLGSSSGICNISVFLDSIQPANTNIKVKSSQNETVIEHTSAKTFSHFAAGDEALVPGETYTIYLDDEEYTSFTISEVTTVIGNEKNNFNEFNRGRGPQK